MPNYAYNKVNIYDLRLKLGWTQEEFALVLKIPRSQYVNLELKRRGASTEMQEKINWIVRSAELMKKRGLLKRNSNPPWSEMDTAMIRLKVIELETSIIDWQRKIDKLKEYSLIVHTRNAQISTQINILKQIKAPDVLMIGLSAIQFEEDDKSKYYSLEKLYKAEAKLAAKKVELAFLRKKMDKRPKKSVTK